MRLILLAPALIGLSAQAPAPPHPPVHQVLMYSYGYRPNPLLLEAGKAVTLQFVNRAGKGHDFTAERFFASARIVSGSVDDDEIDLDGGESRSVTLIPTRGTYKVHCGRFLHKQLGMHGVIFVR